MSFPLEWRINDIENTARKANDRLWELDTLRSNMGSLEYTIRELSSEIFRLRSEMQEMEYRLNEKTKE
jgi:chromosome segregation ATPase